MRLKYRGTPVTISLGILFLAAAAFGGYLGLIQLDGNVHEVKPHRFYRSAQLDGDRLKSVVARYGIRSVLNLRGRNVGARWYDSEIAVSNALGVTHYDYGLSARRFVPAAQIEQILAILKGAPQPVLVHCEAGADRTGLVAALYLAEIDGTTPERADGQLSLVFGHFPYLFSRTAAMDDSFWAFERLKSTSRLGQPVSSVLSVLQ